MTFPLHCFSQNALFSATCPVSQSKVRGGHPTMTEGGDSSGGGRDGSLYRKLIGCKPCYSSFPINLTYPLYLSHLLPLQMGFSLVATTSLTDQNVIKATSKVSESKVNFLFSIQMFYESYSLHSRNINIFSSCLPLSAPDSNTWTRALVNY